MRCVEPVVDALIEYLFGTGDGHTTSWVSAADTDADHDGQFDAVGLDFDGDGRRDDAMLDTDGDGRADLVALDTDDDEEFDAFYRDSGNGVWGVSAERPGTHEPDEPPRPPPPAGRADDATVVRPTDLDDDGHDDVQLEGTRRAGIPVADRLYIDSDGDGRFDRVLVDTDGDGAADVSYDDRSPRFGRPRGRVG